MIRIIACVGKNLELGKDGELVFHLKKDTQFFKKMTEGCVVVMGRKTFESIGHPLSNRINYILSSQKRDMSISFEEALKLDCWIIGGASVYSQFLPYAQEIYLTEVEKSVEADVFFPKFDKTNYLEELLQEDEEEGIKFKIKRYLLLDRKVLK